MDARTEIQARLERDVQRIMRHLEGSGVDTSGLVLDVLLTVRGGQLVAVTFDEPEVTVKPEKKPGRKKETPHTDEGDA